MRLVFEFRAFHLAGEDGGAGAGGERDADDFGAERALLSVDKCDAEAAGDPGERDPAELDWVDAGVALIERRERDEGWGGDCGDAGAAGWGAGREDGGGGGDRALIGDGEIEGVGAGGSGGAGYGAP